MVDIRVDEESRVCRVSDVFDALQVDHHDPKKVIIPPLVRLLMTMMIYSTFGSPLLWNGTYHQMGQIQSPLFGGVSIVGGLGVGLVLSGINSSFSHRGTSNSLGARF